MEIYQHDAFSKLLQAIRDTFASGVTQNSIDLKSNSGVG